VKGEEGEGEIRADKVDISRNYLKSRVVIASVCQVEKKERFTIEPVVCDGKSR